jgi:hypothetical protein
MAVMAREEWTDGRLDDLNKKVDDGFMEMRTEFRALRGEMKSEFQAVRGEIQGVRDEVAAMNRNLIQLTWGLIGMMLVGFLGIIATILTQA